jgi:hypothetical protein
MALSCDNARWTSPDVAWCLCTLAPTLAPNFRPLQDRQNNTADQPSRGSNVNRQLPDDRPRACAFEAGYVPTLNARIRQDNVIHGRSLLPSALAASDLRSPCRLLVHAGRGHVLLPPICRPDSSSATGCLQAGTSKSAEDTRPRPKTWPVPMTRRLAIRASWALFSQGCGRARYGLAFQRPESRCASQPWVGWRGCLVARM